ncbi:DNA replication protein DnaC [Leptospira hartskeerlii]|uniref:DNA replication protein DnaC n=1 Tax=Leptospira hartskeerlii TaxID=2023177 RepID=A0A2M9X8Y7_9LEPT|nr:AFG1/ZapE family ATPase [Leptospira hartskeerlii]PJZ24173.1 DNA replication protein DnaC [Leptospira hartskeerlii]PJZ35167.1 DNA replication protein DnaC [Leptospira hartskeerlii]
MNLKNLTPIREGSPSCKFCAGVGFLLEENVKNSTSGVLLLCSCVGESCPCGGKAPYMVYDESQNRMLPCVCHNARMELGKVEYLVKKAGIPSRYRYRTLDRMELNVDAPGKGGFIIAHNWAHDLIKDWGKENKKLEGLYLWGGTGSGKTLLACAILNELIFNYGTECKYAKINRDFLSTIRDSYQKESELHGMEQTIKKQFTDVEVLVLDDFGANKESDWANSQLYDLIDTRYEEEKLTILTSNIPPTDWKDKAEGRIFSRLMEMAHPLHLDCPDYRLSHSAFGTH